MEIFDKLFGRKKEKTGEQPIHFDFLVRDPDGFWWWNHTNFGKYIREKKKLKLYDALGIIKIAFPFDDPKLLNNCPFMCKIGENTTSIKDTKWFGIAYGYKDDGDALIDWASRRFPRYELITDTDDMGQTVKGEYAPLNESEK